MNRVVFLDTCLLGLACSSKNKPNPERVKCIAWLNSLRANGETIVIPEIADYELRRELVRLNLKHPGQWAGHIQRLENLKASNRYLPLSTQMMLKACELWGDLRHRGLATTDDKALDGDLILAAQAIISDAGRGEVIVATTK